MTAKYLKGLSISVFLISLFTITNAQIQDPVDWTFKVNHLQGDNLELVFEADIDPGWHLYSQHIDEADIRPEPTNFEFDKNENVEFTGDVQEKSKVIEAYEDAFEMNVRYFANKAIFVQKVKLKKPVDEITGYLTFMVCNDHMCLPPTDVNFSFKTAEEQIEENTEKEKNKEVAEDKQESSPGGFSMGEAPSQEEILKPVTWTFYNGELKDNILDLYFKASVDAGWHVYDLKLPEDGPIPTSINFDSSDQYEMVGPPVAVSNVIEEYDPTFEMNLRFFNNEAIFKQKVKLLSSDVDISGYVEYMTCDDHRCLPPDDVNFDFKVKNGEVVSSGTPVEALQDTTAFSMKLTSVDINNPVNTCGNKVESNESKGFLSIFLLGLLGGFLALLTPCVFPMIPLTVSFFTKKKGKGIINASLYGFFIFVIYLILSIPFHLMDTIEPEILNTISTNWILNVAFFVIFVVFAISFFGYFEITLPSSMANKVDSASDVGGILGIFFMALTLAIVSFSCTGPILGSLLAGSLSSSGGAMQLTFGMAGFGLALALPFAIFAMFPGLLNSLPRSGSWLNTVKVVLGFLELAFAVKFLSNADLVEHWGILKREIFFGLWVIIGIGLFLYLIGKIKFPHDSPLQRLSAPRIGFAVLILAFVIYLLPGLTNTKYANLKLLSGFPPPTFYSIYHKDSDCPLGIDCFKDFEEGMAYAKKVDKPVMLDFTGWACVNCRKMEENVWVEPEVYKKLHSDFVLISLYVDDRKSLPEDDQITITTKNGQTKKLRTVGNKWATFQTENFANNSQPYYVLMSPDEKLLTTPVGYTPDPKEFSKFLSCGLDAYKSIDNLTLKSNHLN